MSEISSGTVLITGSTGSLGRSATMAMANRPEGERPDLRSSAGLDRRSTVSAMRLVPLG